MDVTGSGTGVARNITSYGDDGFSRYLRAAFLAGAGYDADDLSRPLVGIADLSSDYNPCHRLMPGLVEQVKRGVLQAGGLPFVTHPETPISHCGGGAMSSDARARICSAA